MVPRWALAPAAPMRVAGRADRKPHDSETRLRAGKGRPTPRRPLKLRTLRIPTVCRRPATPPAALDFGRRFAGSAPGLPQPVNCAPVESCDGQGLILVWSPNSRKAKAEQSPARGGPCEPPHRPPEPDKRLIWLHFRILPQSHQQHLTCIDKMPTLRCVRMGRNQAAQKSAHPVSRLRRCLASVRRPPRAPCAVMAQQRGSLCFDRRNQRQFLHGRMDMAGREPPGYLVQEGEQWRKKSLWSGTRLKS